MKDQTYGEVVKLLATSADAQNPMKASSNVYLSVMILRTCPSVPHAVTCQPSISTHAVLIRSRNTTFYTSSYVNCSVVQSRSVVCSLQPCKVTNVNQHRNTLGCRSVCHFPAGVEMLIVVLARRH